MGEGETGLGQGLEKLSESKMMLDRREEEEEEVGGRERGTWTNPCDFFISCLGYAVGLGRAQYF